MAPQPVPESPSDSAQGSSGSGSISRYPLEPALDTGRFGRSHLRWTVAFAALVLAITTLPLWLPALAPRSSAWACAALLGAFTLVWLCIAAGALCNFCALFRRRPEATPSSRRFRHIVVVPCYLDPLELVFDCLGSLLAQRQRERLVVVVAFERKTPGLEEKIGAVRAAFERRFGDLIITVHTVNHAREIPGGCSNKNHALRKAHAHVSTHHGDYQQVSYTVTTCDTDSIFSPWYFDALEACYERENPGTSPARMCVWQPPVFYNWHLDERPFFVRVTGIVRAMMMLGGLISFGLNPMSIFSYPLELGLAAGFINPRYSVDDIIFKVRCMCATGQRVPVLLMPAPVISGPTIGTSFTEEISEWARQARRWMIGASESFHYFVTHWRGRPFFTGLRWFFTFFTYYAVLLCCAGVFQALTAVPLPWATDVDLSAWGFKVPVLRSAGLAALGLQYLTFAVAFLIDRLAVRLMAVEEHVNCLRNFVHWVLSPLVLLVYQLVTLYAVLKFVFAGKRDAGHVMAAKEGFSTRGQPQEPTLPEPEEPAERPPLDRACPNRSFSFSATSSFQSMPSESARDLLPRFCFGSAARDVESVGPVGGRAHVYRAEGLLP